jgi:carboxypeptidase family protein
MMHFPAPCRRLSFVLLASLAVLGGTRPLAAQSMTDGVLEGRVSLADGTAISGVRLSLLDDALGTVREVQADLQGRFTTTLLAPGHYTLRAEQSGFQPLRVHGVRILGATRTILPLVLSRRPPPITRLEEIDATSQRFEPVTPRAGDAAVEPVRGWEEPRLELTESGRSMSLAADPFSSSGGFTVSSLGLPQQSSRLLIDGVPALWMRHPGLGVEPAGTPGIPSYLLSEVQAWTHVADGESYPANGLLVQGLSRRGGEQFRFHPFVALSGPVGVPASQNPSDASVRSIWAGATVSGAFVPNRAHYVAGFHYSDVETSGARPWENDQGTLGGVAVPLAATAAQVATDSFGTAIGRYLEPVVRRTHGGGGGARVDWQLAPSQSLSSRVSLARWKEESPILGRDQVTEQGAGLDGKDFSATVALASSWVGGMANEARIAFRSGQRTWSAPGLPGTYLVGDGIAVGRSPLLPGDFKRSTWDFIESFQYAFGSGQRQHVKIGLQFGTTAWRQQYVFGRDGIFQFGDLDQFANGTGSFFQASVAGQPVSWRYTETGAFAHYSARLGSSLQVFAGIRWDRQRLPTSGTNIALDTAFVRAFGLLNDSIPHDNADFAPRAGLFWESGGDRGWTASLSGGWDYGQLDPAVLSEVMRSDGDQRIRRGVGTFATWPDLPDTVAAPFVGQRIALFSSGRYRNPRTTKLALEVNRRLPGQVSVTAQGGYYHTDYLPVRTDLNLPLAPSGFTTEGRPVYGVLEQHGGLLLAQPGTNRRVSGFDLVSALATTGFVNHVEAGVSVERQVVRGLSLGATYRFGRTRDNWLRSWSGDPADEVSPFHPGQGPAGWARGRSDFDVPHRLVAFGTYRTGRRLPITIGARYRLQSGLPYTPGFRPGVDANGDGSGGNDPAKVDPAIPGMPALIARVGCLSSQQNQFAERNSCRAPAQHALDLSLAIGMPVASLGGRVEVLVDAFNLVATGTGPVDQALVLVDPSGSLTKDAQGNTILPLLANPRFGRLASRRSENRLLRIGFQLGY